MGTFSIAHNRSWTKRGSIKSGKESSTVILEHNLTAQAHFFNHSDSAKCGNVNGALSFNFQSHLVDGYFGLVTKTGNALRIFAIHSSDANPSSVDLYMTRPSPRDAWK